MLQGTVVFHLAIGAVHEWPASVDLQKLGENPAWFIWADDSGKACVTNFLKASSKFRSVGDRLGMKVLLVGSPTLIGIAGAPRQEQKICPSLLPHGHPGRSVMPNYASCFSSLGMSSWCLL